MAARSRPVRLVPERNVEQTGGPEYRALGPEPWLRLDGVGPAQAGRWVRIRFRLNLLSDPARPLLRFDAEDGPTYAILPGPVCGSAVWVGRVPDGATALAISPVRHPGPFCFAIDGLEVLSRPRLLAGALMRNPGLTLTSLVLRLRGLKLRARHFLAGIWGSVPFDRSRPWLRDRAAARLPEPAALRQEIEGVAIGIVIRADGAGPGDAEATRRALAAQDWQSARVWTASDPAALDAAIAEARAACRWVAVLRAGDILVPHALSCLAASVLREPGAVLVYADEDGPSRLELKPDWSPRRQLSGDYLGGLLLARADLLADAPDGRTDSVVAAAARSGGSVAHVRRILLRPKRLPRDSVTRAPRSQVPARRGALEAGTTVAHPPRATLRPPQDGERGRISGTPRDDGGLQGALLVSVVIPNRDSPDLIATCLRGLCHGTDYPALEIVVVDNGSADPATLDLYRSAVGDRRVEILERPGPFNFSRLTNAGVAASSGGIVLLLNNDIEVIGQDWLRALVSELSEPDVGAVGAKLLYPDGRIQHSGVTIGLGGGAGHVYRGRSDDRPGWMGCLAHPHEVSAVTGACLAVRRAHYDAVGGLDEELFPVSYNDIDFCLKLRQKGLRNILTPASVLYHHESASRGRDIGDKQARADREARHFAERWLSVMRDDPYFHPGLSLHRFDVQLG